MIDVGDIWVDLRANLDTFNKDLNKAEKTVQAKGNKSSSGSANTLGSLKVGSDKLIASFTKLTAVAGSLVAVGATINKMVTSVEALKGASNIAKSVFPNMSRELKVLTDNSHEFLATQSELNRYIGTYGSMAGSLGLAESGAFDLTKSLMTVAGGYAELMNIPFAEAAENLKGVFTGESGGFENFGTIMTDSVLNAYLAAKGYDTTFNSLSEVQQALVRTAFLQDDLSKKVEATGEETNSWQSAVAEFKSQWEETWSTAGAYWISVFTTILNGWNKFTKSIEEGVMWLSWMFMDLESSIKSWNFDGMFKRAGAYADQMLASERAGAEALKNEIVSASDANKLLEDAFNGSANSADETTKSANELKRTLLSFDKLNLLDNGSVSSGLANAVSSQLPDTKPGTEVAKDVSSYVDKEGKDLELGLILNWDMKGPDGGNTSPAVALDVIAEKVASLNGKTVDITITANNEQFEQVLDGANVELDTFAGRTATAKLALEVEQAAKEKAFNDIESFLTAVTGLFYTTAYKASEYMAVGINSINEAFNRLVGDGILNFSISADKMAILQGNLKTGFDKNVEAVNKLIDALRELMGVSETTKRTYSNDVEEIRGEMGLLREGSKETKTVYSNDVAEIRGEMGLLRENSRANMPVVVTEVGNAGKAAENSKGLLGGLQTFAGNVANSFSSYFKGIGEDIVNAKAKVDNFIANPKNQDLLKMVQMAGIVLPTALAVPVIPTVAPVVAKTAPTLTVIAGGLSNKVAASDEKPKSLSTGLSSSAVNNFKSIPTLQKNAEGAVAYGPILSLIGEYSTARTNPEIIAPLSDLKGLMGGSDVEQVRLLREISSALQALKSSTGDVVLKVNNTELGRATVNSINALQRTSGKTLLTV